MRRRSRARLRATTTDSLNLDPSFARNASPTGVRPEGEPQRSPMARRRLSNGEDGNGLTRARAHTRFQ